MVPHNGHGLQFDGVCGVRFLMGPEERVRNYW